MRLMRCRQRYWQSIQESAWLDPCVWKTEGKATSIAKCITNKERPHTQAKFVEYSRGNLDTSILRRFLLENGDDDSALGSHYGYGLMLVGRNKLPGFWWAFQDNILALPRPTHELAEKAHRAMVDIEELRILFQDVVTDSAV